MDQRLEDLSDKVRRGTPIGFAEAIEVINYQTNLKAEKRAAYEKTLVGRFMKWGRGLGVNRK